VTLFCGIDWAETHHDVAIINNDGDLVAKKRIPDDPEGFTQLIEILAEAGDAADALVPVAIETPRGLLVAALRSTERSVYCDQPFGGGTVSRTAFGGPLEIRPRRCHDAGQHLARRRPPAPPPTRRQRAVSGDNRVGSRSSGCDLGPH
jgi:hypothetical protein